MFFKKTHMMAFSGPLQLRNMRYGILSLITVVLYMGTRASAQSCMVDATPGSSMICSGGSTPIIAVRNGIIGPVTWSLLGGGTPMGLNTTIGDTVIASPLYTTTYVVSGFCQSGGVSFDTITIEVLSTPVAALTDLTSLNPFVNCGTVGSYVLTIDDNSSGVISGYILDWGDGSTPYNSTIPPVNLSHTYLSQGVFSLSYVAISSNGCNDTIVQSVFNGSNPSVGLGSPGNTNGCLPLTLSFPITGTSGNTPGTTYQFDFNDGSAALIFSHPPPAIVTHTFTSNSCGATSSNGLSTFPNSFSVSLTATNPCGQSAATSSPIYVSQPAVAGFSINSNSLCLNSQVTFTNTSTQPVSIQGPQYNCDSLDRQQWTITPTTGWTVTSGQLGTGNATGSNAGSDVLGVTFSSAGTYTIQFIISGGCGSDTSTQIITVGNGQAVSAGSDLTVCQGAAPFMLAGFTPVGGTWSGPFVNPSGMFTPDTLGVFPLVYTVNSNGCFSTDTMLVTVTNQLQVNAGADTVVCNQPVPITLNGSPSGGTWFGPFVSSGGVFTPNGIGTFVLVYTNTNISAGCTGQDSMIVTVVNSIVANAGQDISVCQAGGAIQLTGIPAGGIWNGVGVSSSGLFTPTNTGVFNLTYTYSSGSCSSTDTMTATVSPFGPSIAAALTTGFTGCAPFSAAFQLSGYENNDPNTLYVVSYGDGTPSDTIAHSQLNPISPTVLPYTYLTTSCGAVPNSFFNFFVQAINSCGSASAAVTNIQVLSSPQIQFTSVLQGVINIPITFSNTSIPGNGPNCTLTTNYFWNFGDGSFLSVNNSNSITHTYASPGTYAVSLASVGAFCGNDTAHAFITILSNATACAGPDVSICQGASTTIGCPSSTGFIYSWTPATGLSSSTIANPVAQPSVTTTYTLTATDPLGFVTTDQVVVTVNPLPLVNAGPDIVLCDQPIPYTLSGFSPVGGTWGGSPQVTSSGVFTPNGTGSSVLIYTYVDPSTGCTGNDFVFVTVVSPQIANAGPDVSLCESAPPYQLAGFSPTGGTWGGSPFVNAAGLFTPITAGTYTLTYTFGTGTCSSTDSIQVAVIANPNVVTTGDTVCAGQTATLSVGGGGAYLWSNGATTSTINVTPSVTTSYTVTVTVAAGCSAAATATATVNPLPVVNAGPDVTLCNQLTPYTLTGASPSGGIWSGSSQVTPAGIFTPNGIGTYALTYTYFNSVSGCINFDSMILTVAPEIQAGFTYALNGLTASFTNTSTAATGYNWNFGDGGTSTQSNPSHTYSAAGAYVVTMIAGNGICPNDTIQQVVLVGPSAIHEADDKLRVWAYPNPTTSNIILEIDRVLVESEIILFDSMGRRLNSEFDSITDNRYLFSMHELSSGLYCLVVVDHATGRSVSVQLIKQ